MTGAPTIVVQLDDRSGTWPYDVSAFVELQYGITVTRGRDDEYGSVQPSSLTLTFNNTDGRFSAGSTTYLIDVDTPIRYGEKIGATTYWRFTGYVSSWPTEWPDGGQTYCTATISATDEFARLARRTLRSPIEQEYLTDSPDAYYPLTEDTEATQALNVTTQAQKPLTQSQPDAAASLLVKFGVTPGPIGEGKTGALFRNPGNWLTSSKLSTVWRKGNWTFEAFFQAASGGVLLQALTNVDDNDLELAFDGSTGALLFVRYDSVTNVVSSQITGPTGLADGTWHHVAITESGATRTMIVDGTPAGSVTDNLTVDTRYSSAVIGLTLAGDQSMAHIAWGPAVSATRIAAHAAAGVHDDSSGDRIARYAGWAGIPTSRQVIEPGAQDPVPALDTNGLNPLAAMQQIEDAEYGLLFMDGQGRLTFQARTHRYNTSSKQTFAAADVGEDTKFVLDNQGLINSVTATRPGGSVQLAEDAASIAAYGQYPLDLTPLVNNDNEALYAAQHRVDVDADPAPKITGTTVDLLTLPTATVTAVLTRELGDLITVNGLPSQAPAASVPLFVEGWTEKLTVSPKGDAEWSWTPNTSPATAVTAPRVWVLGDATYGALDGLNTLAY